jgi:hypothetical protein
VAYNNKQEENEKRKEKKNISVVVELETWLQFHIFCSSRDSKRKKISAK